jgi:type VI protein secretion system component VasK
MKIRSIISIVLFLANLSLTLLALWFTLGWKVRRTRKAFEKQLIRQGMAKKDAKRLSVQYSKMKNEIMNTLKDSMVRNL